MKETRHPHLKPNDWVEQYSDQLFRFALVRVNQNEIAEDLVQETFIAALKQVKKFRGESSEKTWLFTILKNKIIDYYRSSEKKFSSKFYNIEDENGNERYFYLEGKMHGEWQQSQHPLKMSNTADKSLLSEEFYAILELCLTFLPVKWAAVFRLKTMDELDSPTICKELEITSSNLWVIIHRAKLQMRECMEKKWIDEV